MIIARNSSDFEIKIQGKKAKVIWQMLLTLTKGEKIVKVLIGIFFLLVIHWFLCSHNILYYD